MLCDYIIELRNTGYQIIIRHLTSSLCLVALDQPPPNPATAWGDDVPKPFIWATVFNNIAEHGGFTVLHQFRLYLFSSTS